MKLRLSDKDLLLALGIAVAVIITVTTLVFTDRLPQSKTSKATPAPPRTGLNKVPSVLLKKMVEAVEFNQTL